MDTPLQSTFLKPLIAQALDHPVRSFIHKKHQDFVLHNSQ